MCVVCRTVMHRATSVYTVHCVRHLTAWLRQLAELFETHPPAPGKVVLRCQHSRCCGRGVLGSGGAVGSFLLKVGWTDGEGWGVPTLPPLTWRVQPAVCAQFQKNGNTCTPARVAMGACRREAKLFVSIFFVSKRKVFVSSKKFFVSKK